MSKTLKVSASASTGSIVSIFGDMLYMPDELVGRAPFDGFTLLRYTNNALSAHFDVVTLAWPAITGASGYIVQVCENQNFRGPTLQSWKQAGNSKVLTEGVEIIRGAGKTYHWRFFAYRTGAMSSSSESWSFRLDWSFPDLQDQSQWPTGYGLIEWSDPSVGKLYQGNMLDTSEVLNPLLSNTLPIPNSPFAGTPVEIAFSFKANGMADFSNWVDSTITNNVTLKLLRTDALKTKANEFVINRHLSNSGTDAENQLWQWDATQRAFRQTAFIESVKNVSVGQKFILEVSIDFNAHMIGHQTCKYYRLVTVEARDKISSPYEISVETNLHDARTTGQFIKVKGDLSVSGMFPLQEGDSDLSFDTDSNLRWTPVGAYRSLKTGMFLKNPLAVGVFSGYVKVSMVNRFIGGDGKLYPTFAVAFAWSSTELAVTDLGSGAKDATLPQLIAFQKVCVAKWGQNEALSGYSLLGLKQESGDWVALQDESPYDGSVQVAEDDDGMAMARPVVIGADGLPMLGVGSSHVQKSWRKLLPRHFETDPTKGAPGDLVVGDVRVLAMGKTESGTVADWTLPYIALAASDGDETVKDGVAANGDATEAAPVNHVHPLNVDDVNDPEPLDGTPDKGDSTAYARHNHKHAVDLSGVSAGPALSDTVSCQAPTANAGKAATASRGDHQHPSEVSLFGVDELEVMQADGVPHYGGETLQIAARINHRHPLNVGTANTAGDVADVGAANSRGDSTLYAREDHVHKMGSLGTTITVNGVILSVLTAYVPIVVGGHIYFRPMQVLGLATGAADIAFGDAT